MASLLGGFAGLGGGSIGRASVDLVLNAATYSGQLAAAEGETTAATNKMATGFAGFQQKVKSSFSGAQIAAVGFGAVAAGALVKAAGAAQQWGQEVFSLQNVTGQTAQDASRLAAVADELGVSTDKATIGFGLLSKSIVNGSKNFDKYGIATKDAMGNTLPFNTVLANIADKFQTLAPGTDQAAFAMNVFGRSGKSLIPILQQGAAGLQDLFAQVSPGLVLTQEQIDANRQLGISERVLGEAFKGIAVQVGNSVVPAMTAAVKALTEFIALLGKIPGPITSTALAFVALNGALVLVRGIWSVVSTTITENAAALGLHTAALEVDTAATTQAGAATTLLMGRRVAETAAVEAETVATEQAGIATRALNSSVAASVPQLIALTIATQHAITEWTAIASGDWAGALNTVTSAASDFGLGLQKVTVVSGGFADGLKQVQAGLADGTLTTDQATQAVQDLSTKYGVTLPQAVYDSIKAQTTQTAATTDSSVAAASLANHQAFLASQTYAAAKASEQHAAALRAEKIATAQLSGGLVGLVADQEAVNAAQVKVNQLRDAGKKGTLEYHDAIATLISAQQTLNQDEHTQAQSMRQNNISYQELVTKLEGVGHQLGLTKAETDKFITGLKGMKALLDDLTSKAYTVEVKVNTSAIDAAAQKLHGLQSALARGLG